MALKTALRCWSYASQAVGKEVPEESASVYRRKVEENEPDHVLHQITVRVPRDCLEAEIRNAEPGSDYATFLKRLAALQKKPD